MLILGRNDKRAVRGKAIYTQTTIKPIALPSFPHMSIQIFWQHTAGPVPSAVWFKYQTHMHTFPYSPKSVEMPATCLLTSRLRQRREPCQQDLSHKQRVADMGSRYGLKEGKKSELSGRRKTDSSMAFLESPLHKPPIDKHKTLPFRGRTANT